MQVAFTVDGGDIDALGIQVQRSTSRIVLEVIARRDSVFLSLQRRLLTVHLCQLRHQTQVSLDGVIDDRLQRFYLVLRLYDVFHIRA